MNNNNMRGMVVDIDGVICDSSPWLEKHIEYATGLKIQHKNPREFKYGIDIPMDQLVYLIDEALVKYKEVMEPCNNATTHVALGLLEKKYGAVNFLSARSEAITDITEWWLKKNFPNITFNLNSIGDVASKFEWMKENGFTAIVDDRYKTVNEVDFDNGYTYLVNQPWNTCRMERNHVSRVKSLYDAVTKYVRWRERNDRKEPVATMEG